MTINGKLLGIVICLSLFASCREAQIQISGLTTERLDSPISIDCRQPRFGWVIESDVDGVFQTGYHILVASSPDSLDRNVGDIWDSGEVVSDASSYILYEGRDLCSREQLWWKVRVFSNVGESPWSSPAFFRMAFLDENDWQAKWIARDFPEDDLKKGVPARYLRKTFSLSLKDISKAFLYISGLGLYEGYINGTRVSESALTPSPTDYFKAVKYNVHDVTNLLIRGANTIGIILGNGRHTAERMPTMRHFGMPKLRAQLEVHYIDGSKDVIVSDESWKITCNGPIRANSEFDGEIYDARKELVEWSENGYDDSDWADASLTSAPGGDMRCQINRDICIMDRLNPISVERTSSGTYILDMGQNMVGWLEIRVRGERGDTISLRFAEGLNENGGLDVANLRTASPRDIYIKKSGHAECWEPTFTYHGFRYVEVGGLRYEPKISDFVGKVLYDEMETIGTFECSDTTLNKIYKNAFWGIRGNYRGMPTDCPQRDERLGWLGDRTTGAYGEAYIFANHHLYSKWLNDIQRTQKPDGRITDIAPNYWDECTDNMTWPAAYLTIADMLYTHYGDARPIKTHYPFMKKWFLHMKDTFLKEGIMTRDQFGDWCVPPESPELIHSADPDRKTDGELIGSAYYYRLANLLADFAEIAGFPEDRTFFKDEAYRSLEAFNKRFFDSIRGHYSNNTVTANILPLYFGMVPEQYVNSVVRNVVRRIKEKDGCHVSTGVIGIQYLMRCLSDYGYPDLAFKIASQTTYPSWGYMAENGATTIWELWNGDTADPAMNSANHVMLLGDLIIWMFEYLAGIASGADGVGFKRIKMRPMPVAEIDWVNASHESIYGVIESRWKKREGMFDWEFTIPCNTSACIYVPGILNDKSMEQILSEGGRYVRTEGNYTIFDFPSGTYFISVPIVDNSLVETRRYIKENMNRTLKTCVKDTMGLLALPCPYNVPSISGAFQHEMYYWDTYFTNLALVADGDVLQARNNVDNILYLKEKYGYMPNGSHSGYLNRSQPPYASMMVMYIYEVLQDKKWLERAFFTLVKEYEFWTTQRMTQSGLSCYSNMATDQELEEFYMNCIIHRCPWTKGVTDKKRCLEISSHYMAEAESGWDFTPRFEGRCEDFNPIDLNSNLYGYEMNFSRMCRILGYPEADQWQERAEERKRLIYKYLYNRKDGLFYDYDFVNRERGKVYSSAVFNLIWNEVVDKKQAAAIVENLKSLEQQCGLTACENRGEPPLFQWDYPNGWASIHCLAIMGLDKYGYHQEARRIAYKYVHTVSDIYALTGNLWEKYNVVSGTLNVTNEYDMPPFLGWTAGVYVYAVDYLYGRMNYEKV